MKTQVIIFMLSSIMLFTAQLVMADPPNVPSTPPQAPIDGGLGLLAAAGGAYAIKKLRDKKNRGEELA